MKNIFNRTSFSLFLGLSSILLLSSNINLITINKKNTNSFISGNLNQLDDRFNYTEVRARIDEVCLELLDTPSNCDSICYKNPFWDRLNPGQFNFIFDMVEYQGELYVAGKFWPLWPSGILKWNGTNLVTVPGSPTEHIYTLEIHNGLLYTGGEGGLVSFDGSSWNTIAGILDTTYTHLDTMTLDSFALDSSALVRTLLSSPQGLIVGGQFNVPTENIAIWQDGPPAWDTSITSPSGIVTSLGWLNDDLVVGADFSTAGNNIATWNFVNRSWSQLEGGVSMSRNLGVERGVFCIEQIGNYLYVGGTFDNAVNGTTPVLNTEGFARWDTLTQMWESVGGGLNTTSATSVAEALTCKKIGNDLIIGGYFNQAGVQAISNLARWNVLDNQWHSMGAVSGPIYWAIGCTANASGFCDIYIGGEGPFEKYTPNCDTVYTCQVNFDWALDPTCLKVNFDTTNIIGAAPINFTWKFPDNTTSTLVNPMWTAADTGMYEICLEMIDANGCKDTICQDVAIYDNTGPAINCPSNIFVNIPECDRGQIVNFSLPTTSDNCGVDSVWCNYESGDFFDCGTTVVTCYARDTYGNISSCNFIVNVNCECAQVYDQSIMCGDSATGYDFCIFVEKLNGANDGNCSFNITNNQNGVTVNVDNVNWIHPDTAKITGTIGSTRPIPTQLYLQVEMQCTCPDLQPSNCMMPVTFTTPCCDSIYIEGQEVCGQDSTFYLTLNGSIDFGNIAQTIWYVDQGPCPSTPTGGTDYQISIGYADLLLLPEYYSSNVCVYAEVFMANGPCTMLTTNLDSIEICKPITCTLTDTAYCYSGAPITPEPLCLAINKNGQDCEYSIIWLDENGDTIQGATGLKYQPLAIDFVGAADACSYEVTYTAIVNSVCGNSTCTATIRLDNDNAATGQLSISYPSSAMPYCPGQDVTINYSPACVGTPPMWEWYSSEDGSIFTQITTAGTQNPDYNTNRLFKTTWFMVIKQNGVCAKPDSTILKVEIKDELVINQFIATHDHPCRSFAVTMSVDFGPCTTGNSCSCNYLIDWYRNGQLIHQAIYNSSPATFQYTAPGLDADYSGNYYVIITDNCCSQSKKSQVISLDPPMEVIATGPCSRCFDETITLDAIVLNPATASCTYQWFELVSGVAMQIPGATNLSLQVNTAGTFIFQADCGTCPLRDTVFVQQCSDICQFDVIPPAIICKDQFSVSLDSNGEVEIFPSDVDDGSLDNCMIDTMYLSKHIFDCNDIGDNTVTLTVVDAKGNQSSCSATIDVQDNFNHCTNFCTVDTIDLGINILTGTQIFVAKKVVITESTLAVGSDITMQAKNTIDFKVGFQALLGSTLLAKIEDCTVPLIEPEVAKAQSKPLILNNSIQLEDVSLKIQPNPFRYSTMLIVILPVEQVVNLKVFDQSGRIVMDILKDTPLSAGTHEIPMSANTLKGGMYYINLQTAMSHIMKKAILISDGGAWKRDDD